VFESDPHDFEMIASSLERIAKLAGHEASGQAAALKFRSRLTQLRKTYQRSETQNQSGFLSDFSATFDERE